MTPEEAQRIAQQLVNNASPAEHQALLKALLSGDVSSIFGGSLPEPELLPVPKKVQGFRVRLDLKETKPPVWRRLELPGDLTLSQLHDVIQAAMGWTDSHLHKFRTGSSYQSPSFLSPFDVSEGDVGTVEDDVRLDQLWTKKGDGLWYEYDFGDSWEHVLKVEEVLLEPPESPRCTGGRLACPPEDCGGVWGYGELAAWVRSGYDPAQLPPNFDDAGHAHSWLGPWQPDHFSVDEVNEVLQQISAEMIPVAPGLADLLDELAVRGIRHLREVLAHPNAHGPTAVDEATAQAMVKPYRALLDAVGDGTKLTAAGRLPPAVAHDLAQRTGLAAGYLRPVRREDQLWELGVIRETARSLGLVSVRKGQLSPTAAARRLRDDPVALVNHIAGRLPLGRDEFDQHAGWLLLVFTAVEAAPRQMIEVVRELLFDLGWRELGGRAGPYPSCSTLMVLEFMAGRRQFDDDSAVGHPGVAALARAAIRGDS